MSREWKRGFHLVAVPAVELVVESAGHRGHRGLLDHRGHLGWMVQTVRRDRRGHRGHRGHGDHRALVAAAVAVPRRMGTRLRC